MKKRVLLYFAMTVLMAMPQQIMADDIAINEKNFPDDNFRNYVLGQYYGSDGVLTEAEIATVIYIDVISQNISDLKGIEYFTAIEMLYCNGNQLTSLDVSGCTALTELDCNGNQLTSLDVSKNTALTVLYCYNNQLTSLDVSGCTALTWFACHSNQLTSLDLSKNTMLELLYCYDNQLTSLDVSKNIALTRLCCNNNQLISLDLSKNLALTWLDFYENQLTMLDVSKNTALESIRGWNNQLTSLDVTKNTALTKLYCSNNQLTSLDVTKNTALTYFDCSDNPLTSLDVTKNTALTYFDCSDNPLTSLDVTKNTALTSLSCSNNQLTSLDVSNNTMLKGLTCSNNQLTTLDVSKNTALTELYCDNNQLTSLDLSNNSALEWFYCNGNQLTSLDVTKNTVLERLICDDNLLTSLDVSKNTELMELWCNGNQLASLDMSKNTRLWRIFCGHNQINGSAMNDLITNLLPTGGYIYAIYPDDSNEQNVVTKAQVNAAKEKEWTVFYYNSESQMWEEYEGSDPEISPVEQGETIDIGTDIDAGTNLDGNVVGDVFYSISSGDGSYDPAEGCIVVTKPTDDSAIDGKDIFGEDFKAGYTGVVFKVAPGKGSVKVEAQTEGNMVLKVKIGDNDPIEMELEGRLKVSFPYNVSEETLVYIYGGTNATGAKGIRKAASTGALKIYGIEVTSGTDGIKDIKNERLKMKDTSVYNLNGQRVISSPSGRPGGVPTKGVYIINGKKIVVK